MSEPESGGFPAWLAGVIGVVVGVGVGLGIAGMVNQPSSLVDEYKATAEAAVAEATEAKEATESAADKLAETERLRESAFDSGVLVGRKEGREAGDRLPELAAGNLWEGIAWDAKGLRIAATLKSDLDAVKLYDAFVGAREAAWDRFAEHQGSSRKSDMTRVYFTPLQSTTPVFFSNGQSIAVEFRDSIFKNGNQEPSDP